MGTPQNTAAIYVRRSAAGERDTDDSDNRSHARQERDCQALAERGWAANPRLSLIFTVTG